MQSMKTTTNMRSKLITLLVVRRCCHFTARR